MPAWRDAIPRDPKDEGIGTDDAPQGGGLDRTLGPGLDPGQPGRDPEPRRGDPPTRPFDHDGFADSPIAPPPPKTAPKPPAQTPTVVAASPAPVEPPPPPKPPEDPTAPILARIEGAIAREKEAAREADRRASVLEKAGRASIAESEKWKHREMLVRQQIAELNEKADNLERDALTLDAERDVLARERNALKAALTRDGQRSRSAVLPYKGPNGTWRRPIVLECTDNKVALRPRGPTFSLLELSPLIHPRSSPVVIAIAREMLHIQRSETPDGAPAVPYLVFLVPGRHPFVLHGPWAAGAPGHRVRVRAGRAGSGRRYPRLRRRPDLGRYEADRARGCGHEATRRLAVVAWG